MTASMPDGANGWYLAGFFTEVGNVPVRGLAHVLASGELDRKLRSGVDEEPGTTWRSNVNGMVRIGTSLYVAGGFLSIAGTKRRYFAAFDLLTGELLPWNPLPSALNEGELDHRLHCSFGGDFDYGANTVTTDGKTIFAGALCGLVAFDALSAARPTGFAVPRFGSDVWEDATISTVVMVDGALCVDGNFDLVGYDDTSTPAPVSSGAAMFDARTGALLR